MDNLQSNHITRRRFLQAGAVTSLGLAGLPNMLQADEKKDDPFGGFILGVQSYSFREFDTEPALKRTQDLGLHYVEFYQKHAPLKSTPAQIEALLKLCGNYAIKPVAYGVQRFGKNHDENKKVFEFGKALGLRTFSADPDPDSFDSLDKLVDEYKISIGIHPHGPSGGGRLHRWYSAEVIMDAVKDHNPLIGSCLDTGHLIRSEQLGKKLDPAAQIRVMGARNFGIHLKDHDNKRKTDVVYGKGVLDVPAVLKALKDVKFAGYISIEYEAHPEDPSSDMKACVDVFKDAVKNLS
ncbi:MAG TPA: sugar phosphate isomerase/epimerase [Gemmataceae bacterium]|nr:sugar phosphate isomerase/epimerase [Gemmataceae bacterium]